MPDRLEEIRARAAAAIPGPWRWFGNTEVDHVYLGTTDRGRLYILTPTTRLEQFVFDHYSMETYALGAARSRVASWCPAHGDDADPDSPGECQCDELREFLKGEIVDPGDDRNFDLSNHSWLTRGVSVRSDLRFPDNSLGDGRLVHGGRMQSYRQLAKYEVLGYRSVVEWEMDQGGVVPSASGDIKDHLYREDFCGLDNPEAEFIAHAREDIDYLLGEIDRLRSDRGAYV